MTPRQIAEAAVGAEIDGLEAVRAAEVEWLTGQLDAAARVLGLDPARLTEDEQGKVASYLLYRCRHLPVGGHYRALLDRVVVVTSPRPVDRVPLYQSRLRHDAELLTKIASEVTPDEAQQVRAAAAWTVDQMHQAVSALSKVANEDALLDAGDSLREATHLLHYGRLPRRGRKRL